MNISNEWLINNQFVVDELKDTGYWFKYYRRNIDNVHITITMDMLYGYCSNTVGRDYTIHIDNADFETIFSGDIQTVEHINKALDFIDCEFRFEV